VALVEEWTLARYLDIVERVSAAETVRPVTLRWEGGVLSAIGVEYRGTVSAQAVVRLPQDRLLVWQISDEDQVHAVATEIGGRPALLHIWDVCVARPGSAAWAEGVWRPGFSRPRIRVCGLEASSREQAVAALDDAEVLARGLPKVLIGRPPEWSRHYAEMAEAWQEMRLKNNGKPPTQPQLAERLHLHPNTVKRRIKIARENGCEWPPPKGQQSTTN
jgi:hypothetical protein